MAKRIRIQNDILIKWRIYRYGNEENLTDKKVTLKLFDQSGVAAPITYYFVGNTAIITFEGRNQSKLGDYTLFLSENAGEVGMTTIDKCNAFTLVRHSEQEGGSCCGDMVSVEHVELSSDIDVPCVCFPFEVSEDGVLTVLSSGKQFKMLSIEEYNAVKAVLENPNGGNGQGGNDNPSDGGNSGGDNPSGGGDNPSGGNGTGDNEDPSDGDNTGGSDNPSGDDGNGGNDNPGDDTPSGGDTPDDGDNDNPDGGNTEEPEPVKPTKTVYVGDLNTSRSVFTVLSDADILGALGKREVVANTKYRYTANKNCFVILAPEETEMTVTFTSGGIVTNITADGLWNLSHTDIIKDGTTYKVYGFRMSTVSESSPQDYDITFNKL